MNESHPRFVEIYRARNLPEAYAIRIALEDAGIDARIEGELLQGVVGELPMGWDTAPRILVEDSQASAARAIVDRVDLRAVPEPDADELNDDSRCLACGHAMSENSPKCPACGWSYQDVESEAGDSE